ncbi:MAG: COX15/CtaA family protein [Actinomycetota bacterium]
MRIGAATYRRIVVVAWFTFAAIVITGTAVRLTQSGLGCEDWPGCSEERFVPEWTFHGWVEFGNRILSAIVALPAAAALIAAYRRTPRRPDLIRWSWGLLPLVGLNGAVGAITVKVELHPLFVGLHFLLSMVLLWNVTVLYVRATHGPGPATTPLARSVVRHGRAMVALAVAVLVTGTLVTGTGPNSGDSRAERLQFALDDITRVHSLTVWTFLAVTVALAVRLARTGRTGPWTPRLIAATVVQGGIGYLQFAMGVPPLLVELHVIGSMVVWTLALLTHLHLFERPDEDFEPAEVKPDPALATMNA